jgi:hypothetical protein
LTGEQGRGTLMPFSGDRGREMSPSKLRMGSGLVACAALSAALAAVLGVLALAPARAATILEKNFWMSGPEYTRDLPNCESHPALDRIIRDFHTKEYRFWNSELQIVGFENIHEIDTMPWAAQAIPHRYCGGTAVINNSTKHAIFYSIAEDDGMIGLDWGVNFCVVGLDRNFAYNPDCRAAQP